jgi:hypothetical protein
MDSKNESLLFIWLLFNKIKNLYLSLKTYQKFQIRNSYLISNLNSKCILSVLFKPDLR